MDFASYFDHLPSMVKRAMGDPETLDLARRALWESAGGANAEWANLSKAIGRNHAYLRQYLWKGSPAKLDEDDRAKLAEILNVDPNILKPGTTTEGEPWINDRSARNPQQMVASPNSRGLEFLGYEGARQFEGPKDLPILGHVKAGSDGRFYDQGETHGVTMRPDVLMHVRSAYAVRVQDMSMFPAYEPNDLVYVNPTLAVVPECNVVIQLHDGQAFVKRLIRRTEKAVICQEWYPEQREVRYDPRHVQFIHAIVRIK